MAGFRHYFLNTTNQEQLTKFVNQTATNIQRTFPAGLFTSVGVIVANPAYEEDPVGFILSPNQHLFFQGQGGFSWNGLLRRVSGFFFTGVCAKLHGGCVSWNGCVVVELACHDGESLVSFHFSLASSLLPLPLSTRLMLFFLSPTQRAAT